MGRTNLPGSHPEIRNNLTQPLDQAHRSLSELVTVWDSDNRRPLESRLITICSERRQMCQEQSAKNCIPHGR